MLGKHMLGIYEKALDPADDWLTRLKKAKALGFDFVELCIDESDERIERLYWPKDKRLQLRRFIEETEMPIESMCLSAHRRYPQGSSDPLREAKSMELMERAIDFASEIGIRLIQLAAYDVYYERTSAQTIRRYQENLKRSVDMAAAKNVMLANEIMDTNFINSISRHLVLERDINSPWLKVYPDLGNLSAWGNDVEQELEKGIGSIVQIHIKDTLAVTDEFEGRFRDVKFGQGCVDFKKCFSCLERLGYAGPYMIEMWYHDGDDDVANVLEAKNYIETVFNQALEAI